MRPPRRDRPDTERRNRDHEGPQRGRPHSDRANSNRANSNHTNADRPGRERSDRGPASRERSNRERSNYGTHERSQEDQSSHYAAGRRAALELLRDDASRERIEKVYLAHGVHGPQIAEILHVVLSHKVAHGELDRNKFRELEHRAAPGVDAQGVIVLLSQRSYLELEDVVSAATAAPLLIALDGVEDPHNIGAIIRSAEAAGANGMLLPKRGAVITPTVYKTSAGAANHLPIVKFGNLEQTIRKLQEEMGVVCVGLAGEATESLFEVDLTGPICFITGSEEKGLHRLVRERCEKLVSIPLAGKTASLNASVASAIALFEAVRQRSRT